MFNQLSSEQAIYYQILRENWSWSLLGVKGLNGQKRPLIHVPTLSTNTNMTNTNQYQLTNTHQLVSIDWLFFLIIDFHWLCMWGITKPIYLCVDDNPKWIFKITNKPGTCVYYVKCIEQTRKYYNFMSTVAFQCWFNGYKLDRNLYKSYVFLEKYRIYSSFSYCT